MAQILSIGNRALEVAHKILYGFVQPQGWTKENVPDGVQITHDFGDGAGAVPAIPTDSCGVRNDIVSITRYDVHVDSCSVRNDIISIEII